METQSTFEMMALHQITNIGEIEKDYIMFNSEKLNTTLQQFAPLIGRILIATMFVLSGFDKIFEFEGTQGWMESLGVPGDLLYPVVALEIVGGLAVILGWNARLAAFSLAGFTIITSFIFHYNPADQIQMLLFSKNIALAGGFLFLLALGSGGYSLDKQLAK